MTLVSHLNLPPTWLPRLPLSPSSAHENQHVQHEQAKAMREGREVVFQSVQIKTGICPECGRAYVAGGTTTTVTASKSDQKPVKDTASNREPGQLLDTIV